MKIILISAMTVTFFLLIAACSASDQDEKGRKDEANASKKEMTVLPEPVEISIEQLVGTWKYAEVRILPFEKGIAPMGELLMGITADYTLSHATEGREELKSNLINIPSKFEIKDNQMCAVADKVAEFEFKMSFGSTKVDCYLLNKTEMILGKNGPDGSTVVYKYFSRVE